MKIAIACDHAALEAKDFLVAYLSEKGHQVKDCGVNSLESVDYPDFAKLAVKEVQDGEVDFGILVCGTGIGMSMAANKAKGIRAALLSDVFSAHMTKEHNDANVICFGARVLGIELIRECVDAYMGTEFEGGKHARRVDKIMDVEKAAKA